LESPSTASPLSNTAAAPIPDPAVGTAQHDQLQKRSYYIYALTFFACSLVHMYVSM
jgi:hypothetical protein